MRRESRERVAPTTTTTTTGDDDASTSIGDHASHLHHQYPAPSLLFSNPLSLSLADSPGHRRRGKRSPPPTTATTTGFWQSDVTPTTKVGDVSEIIEEPQTSQNQKRQILSLEIPSTTSEGSTEDFIRITMPPTPNRTPKRVNFSPRPSPSFYGFNDSPSPLSSRRKSSMKNLLPKLSFKFQNSNSEIEKAAILALGGSPIGSQEKPIQRTMSLTKLFAPKMKMTSSLPGTPIEHSNPECTHGGNTINYYAMFVGGVPVE